MDYLKIRPVFSTYSFDTSRKETLSCHTWGDLWRQIFCGFIHRLLFNRHFWQARETRVCSNADHNVTHECRPVVSVYWFVDTVGVLFVLFNRLSCVRKGWTDNAGCSSGLKDLLLFFLYVLSLALSKIGKFNSVANFFLKKKIKLNVLAPR